MTRALEDPLDDYRAAIRRARMVTVGRVLAFVVGLPVGAAAGWAANVALLGDYGGSSIFFFMGCGAIIVAFGILALSRAASKPRLV